MPIDWDSMPAADAPGQEGKVNWDAMISKAKEDETPAPITKAPQQQPLEPGVKPGDIQRSEAQAAFEQKTWLALIKGQLGGQFEPTVNKDDFGFRFGLARRIDQSGLPDAQRILQTKYPEGELKTVDGGGRNATVYRPDPSQPFRFLGDTAEFAGSNLNLKNLGIAASTAIAPGSALISGALGGLIGEGADIATAVTPDPKTRLQLGKDIGPAQILQREALAAGEGSLNAIPSVIQGAKLPNLGAMMRVSPRAQTLIENLQTEGLMPLSVGQLSDSPLVRATVRQTSATNEVFIKMSADQKEALEKNITDRISQVGYDGVSNDALTTLADLQKDRIVRNINQADTLSDSELNKTIQQSMGNYRQVTGAELERQKNVVSYAFKTEGAEMSSMPLKAAAAQIERGVVAPGMDNSPVQLAGPTRAIQPYIDTIKALSPRFQNMTWQGQTDDAFSQLVELRKGLYDLKNTAPDSATRQQAKLLFDSTYDTINNTRGYTPVLGQAVRDWLKQASDRAETLDYFGGIQSTNLKGNIATKLVQPGTFDQTTSLLKILSPEDKQHFIDGFKADLLNNPQLIPGRLRRFANDPETLGLMLNEDEQRSLGVYSNMMKQIDTTYAAKAKTSNFSAVENAINLANDGKGEELDRLVGAAGGPNSAAAQSIKAGMWRDILGRAKASSGDEKIATERPLINMNQMVAATQEYLNKADTTLKSILTPADVKALETINRYAAAIGEAAGNDTAGTFQRGAIISQLRKPLEVIAEPEKTMLHLYSIVNNKFWSEILANPASLAIINTMKPDGFGPRTIKRLVAAGSVAMASDVNSPGRTPAPAVQSGQ